MDSERLAAVDALTRLGGVAAVREVVALSSRRRVRTALANGLLVKVDARRVALPAAEHGKAAAVELGGTMSHLSAAVNHEWEVWRPPQMPQVTVDRRRRHEPAPSFVEVFKRDLAPADREGWTTCAARTVVDCARDLPFADALAVADSALRHGSVAEAELAELAASVSGPGAERVRRVLAYADGCAANPFESALRALCREAGLDVVPQYEIVAGGATLHPDLANPLLGLVVEADSYSSHGMTAADHQRDCARYNAMTLAGWAVLRFTWEHVMLDPTYVVECLRGWAAPGRAA